MRNKNDIMKDLEKAKKHPCIVGMIPTFDKSEEELAKLDKKYFNAQNRLMGLYTELDNYTDKLDDVR